MHSPLHIVIPDDYQDAVAHLSAMHKLAGHRVTIYHDTVKDVDTLAERFRDADALVLIRERTAISEPLLARLPRLQYIAQTGRGTPHVDLAACTRHGVLVSTGGGSPYATAELTWALVLAALRRLPQEVARMKAGKWQGSLGQSVRGRTLGIFGYGNIGRVVAQYGRSFGMHILVWGREGSRERAQADGCEVVESQRALFRRADVLCLHLKLAADTRGIVTAADLAEMSPTALLVNTSRAELIEPGALLSALQAGRPGRAAVDVYEQEPVEDSPLLHLDNVICTPHLGYVEQDSYEQYFGTAFDQILAWAAGHPVGVINA